MTEGALAEPTVSRRVERLFLDNIGKVLTRHQIAQAAGETVENWHQRLSELRTDKGYRILSHRDRSWLKPGEYLMESSVRTPTAKVRVMPSSACWSAVLLRASDSCEWDEDGIRCDLREGDIDPIGGGTVVLTPDHMTPHNMDPNSDPDDPESWRALCGRHQVMKKNFWDNSSGKMNYRAIVQAAPAQDKQAILSMLLEFYGLEIVEVDE